MLSPRRWPYLTVAILFAAVLAHCMKGVGFLDSLSRSGTEGLALTLFLHPFVHHPNPWHLWSDLVLGFVVMGVLIESWVALSWKYRYAMYGAAYVSSLIAYFIKWQWGFTHNMIIGLSGIICAGFGILLAYCWIIRKSLRVDKRDIFALVGLGYLLSFLVSPIVFAFTEYAWAQAQEYAFAEAQEATLKAALGIADTAIYHLFAFGCGFCPALLLFRNSKARSTLLQTRSQPSDTSK